MPDLTVIVDVPDGTDARSFLQDVLDIGLDAILTRGGDPGWRAAHPAIFGPRGEVVADPKLQVRES